MLLTRAPKVEGAALSEKKEKKRKLSGGDDLLKSFLQIHESVSVIHATPRRYISFLHTYMQVYNRKKGEVQTRQDHLQVGNHIYCIALKIKAVYSIREGIHAGLQQEERGGPDQAGPSTGRELHLL